MPKRSEKRDTAKAEYIAKKKKGEEVSLRALAGELGVSYQTLRNWKAADKWEEALPKKKRGGQPGNQNSKGKRNAAGSHDGAPPGNKNAEKDGAYSTVFFDMLSAEELKITESVPLGGREALEHEMKILKFREHKILAKIAEYESQPEDALFVSSLLDMRTPGGRGKDKKDGTNQTMGMYSKDSAFSRVLKLQEALYKVQGRIAKIADSLRALEESDRRMALESQWADRYRMLSAESSAEPGRWHTDKAPYQREIMDAIGDAHIRRVVIMCAAQLGKTELLLNILGYFMAYAPAPILVMQPTLDMGQTFSKDRLAPMIRDTPVLRGLVDVKSRYAGNTILKKNFPGGHITIVGANSATGLASRPIKVLLADEVDRYPGSAGTEGDPLSLAQKRQTTFWDKKTVMVSTPVIKGHSRIETEYNQSTREEWNVPCPECGHYQPFVWANLIFDPDDLQKEIVYKCERCGCVANEYRWKQQSQQGRFVAENPGAETRGFHLNTLASTFCGWKEIVQKFIVAKEQLDQGNPEGMKVWVNTELGETWEERGEQVEDTELFNRREIYDAVVPEEVLVLTAGVDVQDDRFEVEIVGWGVGKESWGIRYQKIYGDMLKEQVWEDLDAFLQTVWCKKDGTALRIISCCIDSGGHHTDQVYRFTKERYERGVWAIKGKGGAEVPYIRNPTTNNRVKTPLFIIGVDAGKALLYQRLRHNTKGPNYCHFPANEEAGYDETYFKGLTSEKMVVRFRKGRSVTVWELKDSKYKRNEPLDLRNYATAALEIANPVLAKPELGMAQRTRRAGRRRITGGI